MFLVELVCPAECEEKLAAVVVGATIGHGYQPSSRELEALVKLVLRKEMSSQKHTQMNTN